MLLKMTPEEINEHFGMSDEEIEEWAQACEHGDYGKFVAVFHRRPPMGENAEGDLVSVPLPSSLVSEIDKRAQENGVDRSEIIRDALSKV